MGLISRVSSRTYRLLFFWLDFFSKMAKRSIYLDINSNSTEIEAKKPNLPKLVGENIKNDKGFIEGQRIPIPKNRIKPLKENWERIYEMIVNQLKLQIRFNTRTNNVELMKSLQRATDFIRAFGMGFELGDAEALIRIDELYLE